MKNRSLFPTLILLIIVILFFNCCKEESFKMVETHDTLILENVNSSPCDNYDDAMSSLKNLALLQIATYIEVMIQSQITEDTRETNGEILEKFRKKQTTKTPFLSLSGLIVDKIEVKSEDPWVLNGYYRIPLRNVKAAKATRASLYLRLKEKIDKFENSKDFLSQDSYFSELRKLREFISNNLLFDSEYSVKYIDEKIMEKSFIEWLKTIKNDPQDFKIIMNKNEADTCLIPSEYLYDDLHVFLMYPDSITRVYPNTVFNSNTIIIDSSSFSSKYFRNFGIMYILSPSIKDQELNGFRTKEGFMYWNKDNYMVFQDWFNRIEPMNDGIFYYFPDYISSIIVDREKEIFDPDYIIEPSPYGDNAKIFSDLIKNIQEKKALLYVDQGYYKFETTVEISKSISLISDESCASFGLENYIEFFFKYINCNSTLILRNLAFNTSNYPVSVLYFKNISSPICLENCSIYSYILNEKPIIITENCSDLILNNTYYIHIDNSGYEIGRYQITKNKHDQNYYVGNVNLLMEDK